MAVGWQVIVTYRIKHGQIIFFLANMANLYVRQDLFHEPKCFEFHFFLYKLKSLSQICLTALLAGRT